MLNARGPHGESQAVFAFKHAALMHDAPWVEHREHDAFERDASAQIHLGTLNAQRTSCSRSSALVTGLA